MSAIEKLVKKEGSASAIAAKLSESKRTCSRQLVEYWQTQGYVTPKWAPVVSRLYGIPLHELNPGVYPKSVA